MRVLGLTGPAGCGKDTVARFIIEGAPLGRVVRRQGFADALKLSATRVFYPDADLETALDFCDWLKDRGRVKAAASLSGLDDDVSNISGRQFLQRYGTESHREVFGEDFWLDAVLPEGRDDCDLLVIPDVRFPNEAHRIHSRDGTIWTIYRPDVRPVEAHASEAGIHLSLCDGVIVNDGTLDDLRAAVKGLL